MRTDLDRLSLEEITEAMQRQNFAPEFIEGYRHGATGYAGVVDRDETRHATPYWRGVRAGREARARGAHEGSRRPSGEETE